MKDEEMPRTETPMFNNSLTEFSIQHPKIVLALSLLLTLLFLMPLPSIRTDTNPKNMLPPTSEVRVWNDSVDAVFRLYEDTIVVGVTDEGGVLNPGTLAKIRHITTAIMRLPGVASRDVTSFTTIDDVTAGPEGLRVAPLVGHIPNTPEEIAALRNVLFDNPLFLDRMISRDEKSTAIYVPLEKGANGKVVADAIREIVGGQSGTEHYHIAGDPVARDTFGAEMFKLMGIFSPIAGTIMFVAFLWMFRSAFLAGTMMLVAMMAIIWSMGSLIGLGFPVHIMSSMAPVFLMAIATDSIHIFNEFFFRLEECGDKTRAIRETMIAVSRPVRYTALATATGFAVLLFMQSVPVKVFGGVIAFGAIVLRLFSISLVPAILVMASERVLGRTTVSKDTTANPVSPLTRWSSAVPIGRSQPAA